jgi:phosphoribosylglycinamide formyltransferase-1
VVKSGATASAITVHVVDEEYDHGPQVAARPVPVEPGDRPEDLEARVTALEPAFFVDTLQQIASGRLQLPA